MTIEEAKMELAEKTKTADELWPAVKSTESAHLKAQEEWATPYRRAEQLKNFIAMAEGGK